jgi:hypothetical protein
MRETRKGAKVMLLDIDPNTIEAGNGYTLAGWACQSEDDIIKLKGRVEALEKAIREIREAPLVAAGKLPPPLPKR